MSYFDIANGWTDKGINLPIRSTEFSAGYDFEAAEDIVIPSIFSSLIEFIREECSNAVSIAMDPRAMRPTIPDPIIAKPVLVPTGIKISLEPDQELQLRNRSSGSYKKGLLLGNGVGTIDADYFSNPDNDGHIMFQFWNLTSEDILIKKGDKIGQGIVARYNITHDDLVNKQQRMGGHGSTGA